MPDVDFLKASFEPVIDSKTRVLILGSLPGEMSLARQQYYAQPTNQFWRLTGAVIERDLVAMPYEQRLAALLSAGIGLWDVIKTAKRLGSGDAAIRDVQANALPNLIRTLPHLKSIAFNGSKSAAIGRKHVSDDRHILLDLPSSSAAYCSISFEQKVARWMQLRDMLDYRSG